MDADLQLLAEFLKRPEADVFDRMMPKFVKPPSSFWLMKGVAVDRAWWATLTKERKVVERQRAQSDRLARRLGYLVNPMIVQDDGTVRMRRIQPISNVA